MTKDDLTDRDNAPSHANVSLKRGLIATIAGIALIFLTGVFAGYLSVATRDAGLSVTDVAVLAITIAIMAAVIYAARRFWPSASNEPVAQSTRKGARILYAMVGLGAIIGVIFAAVDDVGSTTLFSNEPIGGLAAALAIVGWAVIVPAMTWVWWRTVDEHEVSTYADAGVFSAHVYLIGVPTWWLATRAGWLPAQDPMIVWVVIATLWSAIWLYRKYF